MIGQEPVTIERDPGGSFVDGRYVRGAPLTTIPAQMSVQPNRGDETIPTLEGDRRNASYWGYTTTALQTVSDPAGAALNAPDVVIRDDAQRYEVLSSEPWRPEHPIPHTKAGLVEEDPIVSAGAAVAEALSLSIRDWIIAATGLPGDRVLLGRPNGPIPLTTPWLSIVITSDVQVGQDTQRPTTEVGIEVAQEILGGRLATTEITVFGNTDDGVIAVLEDIRTGIMRAPLIDLGHDLALVANRIAVACVQVDDIADASEFLSARYEERARVMALFGHDERRVLVGDAAGGTIDSVAITGDVEGNAISIQETQP